MEPELSPNEEKSIFSLIKNSFSYAEFYKKDKTRTRGAMAESVPTISVADLRIRKNVNSLKSSDDEYKLLKTAIEHSIKTDEYAKFVTIHSQYSYRIHSVDAINQRFLPWHRVFLIEYEKMLNTVMKKENPDKDYNIALPYWDWEHDHDIPEFYKDLTPKRDVKVYLWISRDRLFASPVVTLQVKRFPNHLPANPELTWPDESLVTRIKQNDTFKNFSLQFEAGKDEDNDKFFGPHGSVHMLAGGQNDHPDPNIPYNLDDFGTMANILISPLDPLFYSHHANVDRIWSEWQKEQEDKGGSSHIYPDLNPVESILDPWPEYTESKTRKTEELGYKYGK
jgi:tyrosinase